MAFDLLSRTWIIGLVVAVIGVPAAGQQTVFYNDETEWSEAVTDLETFDTTSANVALAMEIKDATTPVNTFLGYTLTFDTSSTGLSRSFVTRALENIGKDFGWTYDDNKLPGGDQALSPNDVGQGEDDDFEIEITSGPPLLAFGMWVVNNDDPAFGVESLSVFDDLDQLLGRTDLSEAGFPGGDALFLGVVADRPIARVVFDEDPTGDDIGVRDFRFAAGSSTPTIDLDPGQSQVNTVIAGYQFNSYAAVAPSGRFVVVWQKLEYTPSAEREIRGRSYDAAGHAVAADFLISTYTAAFLSPPSLTATPAGEFVVVWDGPGPFGDGVQARRLSSTGVPVGSQFLVSPVGGSARPDVDAGAGGDLVVTWDSASGSNVEAQRLDSDGLPMGAPFMVNQYTSGGDGRSQVAVAADGGFVVVWESLFGPSGDGDDHAVLARRFSSDGSPLDGEMRVNSSAAGDQYHPAVATLEGGGFVVVWESESSLGSDDGGNSVQGRRFDSLGNPLELEFQVNSITSGRQAIPAVAATGASFTVVWTDLDDVLRQSFSESGAPIGSEEQIAAYTTGIQSTPVVAVGPAGDLVLVWSSFGSPGNDNDLSSVQLRTAGRPVFADGFESGDTSSWSSAVP